MPRRASLGEIGPRLHLKTARSALLACAGSQACFGRLRQSLGGPSQYGAATSPYLERIKPCRKGALTEDPDVIDLLQGGVAPKAERGIVIHVDAFDWNCPQHIPIRLTDAERHHEIARLTARIAHLESQLHDQTPFGQTPERLE